MTTDDPRDPTLDSAYRATARDEPPRELDERILAAAHRAVNARPAAAGRSFAQRWRVPVALAATVVLSATVTLMIYESEKSPPALEMRRDEGLREQRAAPASPPAKDAGKLEAGTSAPTPSAEPGVTGARSKIEAPRGAGNEEALRQSLPESSQRKMSVERKSSPEPASAPAPAQPAPTPFPAAPARPAQESPPPAEPLAKKRAAPGAAAAPAAEADQAPASLSRERALADRPAGRTEREAASGAAQALFQTPEEWIMEIRKLKEAGRTDEANRLLAEFRERFTDYPLPEDLR